MGLEYRSTFMRHSFLWSDSVDKTFDRFLAGSVRDLFADGFEQEDGMDFRAIMDRIKVDIGPPIPPLEHFDREIAKFDQMKQDLANLKTPIDIHWLRIDAQPVKVTLLNYARRWE